MKSVVELKNVSTTYEGERIPAIHGVNLEVREGDFVVIVGPNGAGKTTLLETINGLLPHSEGVVRVFGKDIKKCGDEIRKRIGYVIQNIDVDPLEPFPSKDVVMMGRVGKIGLLRFPSKSDWMVVSKALDLLGIKKYEQRSIGKLSGGEIQKVLIARALAQEPDLLLLDEPLSNLDFSSRNKICNLLERLNIENSMTILMVSHDLHFIPKRCSRAVVMDKGRIVFDGGREEALSFVNKLFEENV